MENKLELLNILSDTGINFEELLLLMFQNYELKKQNRVLYSMKSFDPKRLIKIYYRLTDDPKFDGIMTNFKQRYIKNENKLEQVHEKCEIEGLGVVYDYIQSYIKTKNINIFIILTLHQFLYSKVPFPEFGGKIRQKDVYLPGSGIETESWDNIPKKLNELFEPTNELIKRGIQLGKEKNENEIIEYIDDCLELNAEIIAIHPFMDGNGRTARAFLNLLFKLANIPPTYVTSTERVEYGQALNKAINEHDFLSFKRFYYYKICDSIYELDIKQRLENINKNYNEQKTI
ncbi:MAG: Fic family protein [Bacilli bacterium]